MMKEFLPQIQIETAHIQKFMSIFFIVLALFCLAMGGFYWIRLIGIFPGSLWRFDLMPWNWRALCSVLAIVYPVAACGLWLGSRWGIILWLVSASVETLCLALYSGYSIWNIWIPVLHVVFLLCYGGAAGMLFLNRQASGQAEVVVDY